MSEQAGLQDQEQELDPRTRLLAAIAALLLDRAHAAFVRRLARVRMFVEDIAADLAQYSLLTPEEANEVVRIAMDAYGKSRGDVFRAAREVAGR